MPNDILAALGRISDVELVAGMKGLIARERQAAAELVAHIAELDTRDVHLREGYSSLFVYCRDALGLSEWEAYNRIDVARIARRFPVVLELLADGSVNLTTVRLLGPHLTHDNHRGVLESARGKKKPEVEEIVARLSPRPDVPLTVRRLPGRGLESSPPSDGVLGLRAPTTAASRSTFEPAQPSAVPAAAVTPHSPDRYKLQVTIGGETLELLRLAQDMLGHATPSGDDAMVLDRALRLLVAELAKRKFADTATPRRPQRAKTGVDTPCPWRKRVARDPSAAVKRAVWVRDLGRCAFVGIGGHRCNEGRFVEFHHVDPYALGGEATVDGIQLRCRRHNDYEGRLYFGNRRRGRELVPEQVGLSRLARRQ